MTEDSKLVHSRPSLSDDTFNSTTKSISRTTTDKITNEHVNVKSDKCSSCSHVDQTSINSSKQDDLTTNILNNKELTNKSNENLSSCESSDDNLSTYESFNRSNGSSTDISSSCESAKLDDSLAKKLGRFQRGKCKWFNTLKGWGFLTPNNGEDDVFVHQSAINMPGFRGLIVGQEVNFEIKLTNKGREAMNVTIVDETCDRKKSKIKQPKKIRCFNCGEFTTHLASECDQIPQPKKCHHCKSEDHLIGDCPLRIAYQLLDEELGDSGLSDNLSYKSNESDELCVGVHKSDVKEELRNRRPSCERIQKQQQTPDASSIKEEIRSNDYSKNNYSKNNYSKNDHSKNDHSKNDKTAEHSLVTNKALLTKTTKKLMNYKKSTKKIKRNQSTTSSLSNASFSSSSEISSSSIPSSKSISPYSFSQSIHLNEQSNHLINEALIDHNSRDPNNSYLIDRQTSIPMINDQFVSEPSNLSFYDQSYPTTTTYTYYDDNNGYRDDNNFTTNFTDYPMFSNYLPMNQPIYSIGQSNFEKPIDRSMMGPYKNHQYNQFNRSNDFGNRQWMMTNQNLQFEPMNYPPTYQSDSTQSMFANFNQTSSDFNPNRIIYPHPIASSPNSCYGCSCRSMNYSLFNSCSCVREPICINHHCRHLNNCCNQSSHSLCSCKTNFINHSICSLNNTTCISCSNHVLNHQNYINHHCDSMHHHSSLNPISSCHHRHNQTDTFIDCKATCHNQCCSNNNSYSTADKKVLDRFETDSEWYS